MASSTTQVPLFAGMVLGGVMISALGAGSTIYVEEKKPSPKSLTRDFIIGAIMVAMIMQLLPESSTSIIQMILGLVPLSLFSATSQKGGGDAAASVTAAIGEAVVGANESTEEMEVKVGVPRF